MMRLETRLVKSLAALALLLALPPPAAAQTVPAGWSMEQHGDEVRVSPRGLRSDQVFYVAGLPDEAVSGRELRGWFDRRTSRDARKLGAVDSEKPIEPVSGGVLKKALAVRTAEGRRLAVIYLGGLGVTRRFELYRIVSTPDRALAEKHMQDAFKVIASWPSRPAGGEASTGAPSRRQPAREDRTARYRTRPGGGIKPSEIEFFTAELELEVQPDLSVMPTYKTVMVLKNGEACKLVNVPPSDMDVAAHKQAHPGSWGKWRRSGRTYERLTSKGAWKKVDWKLRLYPARPGDELRGKLTRTSASVVPGGGDASTAVASVNSFVFLPGRRFRDERFSSVSHHGDSSGGRGGVSVHGSSEDEKLGTYVLDGSTLELRYADGTVDRRAFLWTSEKRTGSVVLNTSVYLLKD
jgi:hypothetical protein